MPKVELRGEELGFVSDKRLGFLGYSERDTPSEDVRARAELVRILQRSKDCRTGCNGPMFSKCVCHQDPPQSTS